MVEENYFGFIGNLISIDLTNGKIYNEKIDKEIASNFMGGAGYASNYLFKEILKETDPLSPENIFMVMTGPLCSTGAPSFSRIAICAKSPYTGLWGEANAGGYFGPELKKAGYDGIIIRGKSRSPVFINIFNDNVEIKDASHIWGQGTKKTHKILKNYAGSQKARVICIGQGGENLVFYAIIHTEGRAAGRTGMGAVLGSKNLKGIVVKGDSYKPQIARLNEFNEISTKMLKFILNTQTTSILRKIGTSAGVATGHESGDLPIKYWSKGEWSGHQNITGKKIHEHYNIKNKSCHSCAIGCGKILDNSKADQKGAFIEIPEYETIAGFGSMILNENLESIAIANFLCNDYGLDTISTSSAIAFLYDLFNQGKISEEDVSGLNLNWGNSDSMLKLIKKIAFRKDIGNLLAQGSNKVGEKFHIASDKIATVNNLEVPYHDIRACYGLSLTYAFGPRGACHTTGDLFKVSNIEHEIDYSSIGLNKMNLCLNDVETAKSAALIHDYRALYSSLICCFFSNPPPSYMADLIKNLMGFSKFGIEDMMKLGERIFTMKRLFNIKMGLTTQNDSIPKILLTPTKEGAVKGKAPNFEKLKQFYYDVRKWNPLTGIPTNEKLEELGMGAFKNIK